MTTIVKLLGGISRRIDKLFIYSFIFESSSFRTFQERFALVFWLFSICAFDVRSYIHFTLIRSSFSYVICTFLYLYLNSLYYCIVFSLSTISTLSMMTVSPLNSNFKSPTEPDSSKNGRDGSSNSLSV
jgi:hypothetical protein